MGKATAAIVGPGNIGTDLLAKLRRSEDVEVRYMVGADPDSDGLARAAALGVEASAGGVDWLLGRDELPDLVFEATSAKAHLANAGRYAEAGVEEVGGAAKGKAIIIINPVEPPMIMRDTVFCAIDPDADRDSISESIERMVADVRVYVPGYALTTAPQYDDPRPGWNGRARVAVFLEVAGNGDYLPPYAGNLDIMTAAAARVGEVMAREKVSVTGEKEVPR